MPDLLLGKSRQRRFSKANAIAHWFGLTALPRHSINLSGHYALIVARHGDRIRLVVGTATEDGGVGGTHNSLTLRQAADLRDELTRLLEINR